MAAADTRVVLFRLQPIDGGNNAATVGIFRLTYFVIELVNRHLSFFKYVCLIETIQIVTDY